MRYAGFILRALFPSTGVVGAPTCKYHPSCSQYAHEVFRTRNPAAATVKTAWRLLRCNPWSHGGVDYP